MATGGKRFTQKMASLLKYVKIAHGGHTDREKGMCVMEAVAYIAGEPHSMVPKCVSESITGYMIGLNDTLRPEPRQKLKAVVPDLIGTHDPSLRASEGVNKAERKRRKVIEAAYATEDNGPLDADGRSEIKSDYKLTDNELELAEALGDPNQAKASDVDRRIEAVRKLVKLK